MGIFSRLHKKEDAKQAPAAPAIPAVVAPAVAHTKKKTHAAWRVIVRPLISEKAAQGSMHNQYTFIVQKHATKIDVRRAIEEVYGVRPLHVTIGLVRGKTVRYGRSQGTTATMKKATVSLPKGTKIQIYEGV